MVCSGVQLCTEIYSGIQGCTVVYSVVQWCTVLDYSVLKCTVVYCSVQWCTVCYEHKKVGKGDQIGDLLFPFNHIIMKSSVQCTFVHNNLFLPPPEQPCTNMITYLDNLIYPVQWVLSRAVVQYS